jgi:hypothetical protein
MISQAVRNCWLTVTGQKNSACETVTPAFALHDPAAQQPHDLDDPFFDWKVQARIGSVIASAVQKQ